jgi:hypothetical protein
MLRGFSWFVTDVSGRHVGSISKGQNVVFVPAFNQTMWMKMANVKGAVLLILTAATLKDMTTITMALSSVDTRVPNYTVLYNIPLLLLCGFYNFLTWLQSYRILNLVCHF